MSLDQLRYFVVVAEEEHLSRAARRLHISQPPLSRQIRALEEEMGTELFERRPKGLRLKAAGRRLLEELLPILHDIDQLKDLFQKNTGLPENTVPTEPP